MDGRQELHINHLHSSVLQTIFGALGPKDLCRSSAVCTLWRDLNLDKVAEQRWRRFYSARWQLRGEKDRMTGWQKLYGAKIRKSRIWQGQYQADSLFGHKGGVRCIKLLPERNLVATGSLDKTVRLWDLEGGIPLSCSKLHGGTVRRLAIGQDTLVSGSTDAVLRVWDLAKLKTPQQSAPRKLIGHTGPISGLALVDSTIYSGSWDCSVRVWDKDRTKPKAVFKYDDWVWAIVCRGPSLVVAAGKDVIFQDAATGKIIYHAKKIRQEGHVSCLESTQDSRVIFTGAADGVVQMHDTRARFFTSTLWSHTAGVSDLAFEDPWVASCSHDGSLAMINIEKKLHSANEISQSPAKLFPRASDSRKIAWKGGPVYCVDMCSEWLACGSESPVVKSWDFRGAEAAAMKARAQREARKRRKGKRLEPKRRLPCIASSDDESHELKESKTGSESDSDDMDSNQQAPLIPPSEMMHQGCGYWNHIRGGESTDEGEMLEAYA
ncbi:hypothetical protein BSKO_08289 [Bryopsis sp. KO-2023]|nr:hypothetical protein BSKO_08289 [Bryopsis sp. KO-2023]